MIALVQIQARSLHDAADTSPGIGYLMIRMVSLRSAVRILLCNSVIGAVSCRINTPSSGSEDARLGAHGCLGWSVSYYRMAPRKDSPGRQFTGKNSPRPAAARAGRILPVNCRPGRLVWERSYPIIRRPFMGQAIF